MALGYDEWKTQYEKLDTATKKRYDEMSKNDKAYQEYSTRYMNEKNATPVSNTTPLNNSVNNSVNNTVNTTNNNSKTSGSTVTNNQNTNTGSTVSNNTPSKNN
jgi:hypothetical protein